MIYTHTRHPLHQLLSPPPVHWRWCHAMPHSPPSSPSHALVHHPCHHTPFHSRPPHHHLRRSSHLVPCAMLHPSPAHTSWAIWALLFTCAASAQLIEQHTRTGKMLSAPLLSMVFGATASSMGMVPMSCVHYNIVWDWIMPMAAALCLLESNLTSLLYTARPVLLAFIIGAIGTVIGTLVAYRLVGGLLGGEGHKMAAALCASYIGGSINFAATAQALGLVQRGLLAACMTADNLAMGLYLSAVMVVPVDNDESKNKSKDKEMQGDKNKEVQGGKDTRKEKHCNSIHEAAGVDSTRQTASVETHTSHHASSGHPNPVPTTSTSLTTALAAAAVSCSVGWWGAHALQSPHLALTLTALACAGVAAVTPEHVFAGAQMLGGCLMGVFFATIGCTAGVTSSLMQSPALFAFIVIQLLVHVVVTLGVGRLMFRLPMRALFVGSNANVGGPATAAAMAASRKWPDMVQPAMLVGGLGYAIGTAVGVYVGHRL